MFYDCDTIYGKQIPRTRKRSTTLLLVKSLPAKETEGHFSFDSCSGEGTHNLQQIPVSGWGYWTQV